MKRLLVIGAGGHGRVVAEIAESTGYCVDFLDDRPGEGVVGKTSDLEALLPEYDEFFVAIGNNLTRRALMERLESAGAKIATLIHPTAFVSSRANVGPGTVVEPKAVVNTNSVIGKGCIISVGAIVDHDAIVEKFAHVNAGAICKSGSHIGETEKIDAGEVVQGIR